MNIAHQRIINQQIVIPDFKDACHLVSYMGAMQAQDFAMAKWAIGCRVPNTNAQQVEDAFNSGKILRTHLMRPTWHFAAAEDLHWILDLTVPQIKAVVKPRFVNWGFDDKILSEAFDVIQKSLSGGNHKTRKELQADLFQANITPDEGRLYHLMLWAELEKVVCSGRLKGKEQTYALLDEWVPCKKTFHREEALAMLAMRFFTSHAPATLADFIWWSGLKTTDARSGLELIKENLCHEKISGADYWFPNNYKEPDVISPTAILLPAFDEFVIAYKNRSAVLNPDWGKTAISSNGIFKPLIVINGQVMGIWKRSLKKDSVLVELHFFRSLAVGEKELVEKAAWHYAHFEGKKLELKMQ